MAFGHKRGGTKVSGAKLKPAIPLPAGSQTTANGYSNSKGKQKETGSTHLEEEEDQYDRSFMESIRKDRPPLSGCLVCFSGIADPVKYQAIAYAEKLGAKVEKNLTLDVTHLICDKPGSKKYHVALKHSIRIMLPLWLEALYSSFTEGEDLDLNDITQRYTMKPLHNLKLAITGRGTTSRTPFIKLAENNGASVSIDLDIQCSHLIVLSLVPPNQTDPAIFEIAKVQAARSAENPIQVVWQEWLEDSVQRRGALPEAPYLVKEGVPRPGRLFLDAESVDALQDQRDFARSMQNEEFETAVPLKNIKSGSQNAIMASIILRQDLPIRRHNSSISTKQINGQTHDNDSAEQLPLFFSQADLSEKPKHPLGSTDGRSVSGFRLNELSKDTGPASIVKKLRSVKSEKFGSPTLSPHVSQGRLRMVPGLFQSLKISTIGCLPIHQRTLVDIVTQSGGQFIETHSKADYTIVPHVNPPIIPLGCNPVGHHWVEKSLDNSALIDPDEHWCGRPVRLPPLPQSDQYIFSSCGFTHTEEHILQQILKVANLKYVEHPRRSVVTHFFIGPDETSSRAQKVKTWTEKKLVDFEWLIEVCDGQRISRSNPQPSRGIDTREASPKSVSDPLQHNFNTEVHHTPLSECVIFMTRKGSLHPSSKSLVECRKLGARVVDKLVESVTHVVHVADGPSDSLRELKMTRNKDSHTGHADRSIDSSRDLKLARTRNIHVVHPHWLSECKNKLARVDEMTFPPTYTPERALSYSASTMTEITMADVTVNSFAEKDRPITRKPAHEESDPILEKDDSFYQSPPPLPAPLEHDMLAAHDPNQTSYANGLDSNDADATEQVQNINEPSSSHHATSPRSNLFVNSSPPKPPEPGVNTQLGGFMEMLQQRNQMADIPQSKERDGRRSRKRGIDHSSRTSGNNQSDERNSSRVIGGGLDRTLSNFSHSSTTASQVAGFLENMEESMDVTWEDPAAKREILKAINDPIGKATKRIANRRLQNPKDPKAGPDGLPHSPTSNLYPVNRSPGRIQMNGKDDLQKADVSSKRRSEFPEEGENYGDNNDQTDDQEITIVPPMKKRKPRLIGR